MEVKLGVNFYHYLKDRLREAGEIPPLAALIHKRATQPWQVLGCGMLRSRELWR